MNEVDARRDRATPAWVRHDADKSSTTTLFVTARRRHRFRHDADGPLIPIFQEEEEADCRGST
jgi:hypothetical protein